MSIEKSNLWRTISLIITSRISTDLFYFLPQFSGCQVSQRERLGNENAFCIHGIVEITGDMKVTQSPSLPLKTNSGSVNRRAKNVTSEEMNSRLGKKNEDADPHGFRDSVHIDVESNKQRKSFIRREKRSSLLNRSDQ